MAGLPGNLSLPQLAPLIQASLELKLVRSIRGAMLAADIASGRLQPVSGLGPAPNPPPPRTQCPCDDDCYEPAKKIQPPPVYLPRKRIQLSPVYEPGCPCEPKGFPLPPLPPLPEGAAVQGLTVQPPWKLVPWKNPLPPVERPKVIVRVIDRTRRGQMIDLFI